MRAVPFSVRGIVASVIRVMPGLPGLLLLVACTDTPVAPDPLGAPRVEPTMSTPQSDVGVDVDAVGADVYLVGVTYGSMHAPHAGGQDVFLRRYDSTGDLIWGRQLGTSRDDIPRAVAGNATGNVWAAGYTLGAMAGRRGALDAFLVKYDASGTELWTRQFGTADQDDADALAVDAAGNAYVVGFTRGALGGRNRGYDDAYVRKYGPSGAVLWTRQFGTDDVDYATAVAVDGSGNVIVGGHTYGRLAGTKTGEIDGFVRKYGPSGNVLWTRQFGIDGILEVNAIVADAAGFISVTGHGNAPGAYPDAFVRRLSPDGTRVWMRWFGGERQVYAWDIDVNAAGDVLVSGDTWGMIDGPLQETGFAFVRKFSATSATRWTKHFGTTNGELMRGIGVAVGSPDEIYLTGAARGPVVTDTIGQYDAYLLQLNGRGEYIWGDQ